MCSLFYYQEFAGVSFFIGLKLIEINTWADVMAIQGGFVFRKCQRSNEIVNFDNFTYEYDGNKLIRVRETISGQNDMKDFPYYNPSGGTAAAFLYDHNGNLTMDVARNISITYNNWLDLPASILYETGRLAYTYGRNGLKIAKKAYNKYNQITLDEQYFGDLVTNRGIPVRILHEDGYIELNSQMVPAFYYYLKDHLGNVRVVFTPKPDNTPAFTQANDYYPFGMAYSKNMPVQGGAGTGTTTTTSYVNKFLYNGKEEQDMPGKWLDYGARFYDPQVGRWQSVDPAAECRIWLSIYNFVQNNPMNRFDPNGALDTKFEDERGNLLYETKDNVDATVVVADEKVNDFNQEVCKLGENTLYNVSDEKKTTVNLASNYMKEGQAVSYTMDDQGNISYLSVGEAALYSVHQVGVRMIGGIVTTSTLAGGITWDSKGNIGLYGSAGLGVGVDGSLGLEYVNNTSYNSDFNIKTLRGTSADYNAGAGVPLIGLDISKGGNANRNTFFTQTGSQYKSNAIGVSSSPYPVGVSRTFENMGVVKLLNVK